MPCAHACIFIANLINMIPYKFTCVAVNFERGFLNVLQNKKYAITKILLIHHNFQKEIKTMYMYMYMYSCIYVFIYFYSCTIISCSYYQ